MISSEASGEHESESGEEGRREEDHWEEAVEHEEEEEQPEEYEPGAFFRKKFLLEGLQADPLMNVVVVPPPTLPPIPTIATGSTSAHDAWEGGFFSTSGLGGGETSTTSTTIPATTRTRTPTTAMGLNDHPLPSPILRDLPSWMGVSEGENGPTSGGGANRSSGIVGQPERHYAHPITNFNSTIIVNPAITSSNPGGTINNSTSTAARASSPSTSTTSTSTVRPSSVSGGGGFSGFAGFGGSASEVSAPSQSAYQGSSIFGGGGNSGRSGADELRLTDPRLPGESGDGLSMLGGLQFSCLFLFSFSVWGIRVVLTFISSVSFLRNTDGPPHEYPPEIWSASPHEALAAMAAYVTRTNPRLRGSSIFGGGENSGRSDADELRLTDPRGEGGDGLPMFGGLQFSCLFLFFFLWGIQVLLTLSLLFVSMEHSRPTTRSVSCDGSICDEEQCAIKRTTIVVASAPTSVEVCNAAV